MRGHRDLVVWGKAMELVIRTYGLTKQFPKTETYGLSNQMQRAAVSIPSNIAEGHALKQTAAWMPWNYRHTLAQSGTGRDPR